MDNQPPNVEPNTIRLTLKLLASRVPWSVRVRRLLKFALRSCGLRNEGIEFDRTDQAKPAAPRPIDRDDADGEEL